MNYINEYPMWFSTKLNVKTMLQNFFIFASLFSIQKCAEALVISRNHTINIDKTIDVTTVTNGWLELGRFTLPKASGDNESHYRCSTGAGSGFCAYSEFRVNGGLQSNPAAYWTGRLRMEPVDVDTENGKKLTFSAYFKGTPIVRWEEHNRQGGRSMYHKYFIGVGSVGTSAGAITQWSSGEKSPSLVCGSIAGCTIGTHTYFDNTMSGSLVLSVKLPADFQKGTYIFSNVPVLHLGHTSRNASGTNKESIDTVVYISGKITVPERCYIETGSNAEIKFNDVNAGMNNGKLEERNFELRTTCKYINLKLKQYVKVSGSNGDSEYEIFSKTSSNDKALALVMNIVRGDNGENYSADCNPSSGRVKFGHEYLLREINGNGLNIYSYNDIIKLSLCKYGVPKDYGEKNIPLTIISRWSDF
ncbi:FasG [Escherichia coli]|uniref:FasG n=1 Tax=Escherichia coli TaxID=562 RepID=UPI00133172B1|nr:FasG [Escherichia coli]